MPSQHTRAPLAVNRPQTINTSISGMWTTQLFSQNPIHIVTFVRRHNTTTCLHIITLSQFWAHRRYSALIDIFSSNISCRSHIGVTGSCYTSAKYLLHVLLSSRTSCSKPFSVMNCSFSLTNAFKSSISSSLLIITQSASATVKSWFSSTTLDVTLSFDIGAFCKTDIISAWEVNVSSTTTVPTSQVCAAVWGSSTLRFLD